MIDNILSSVSLLTLQAFMPPMLLPAFKKQAGYQIARSLRFNSADSTYLSWTPAGAPTSRRVGTIVFWLKRTTLGNSNLYQTVFSAGGASAVNNGIAFGNGVLSGHGDMLEFFEMSAAPALNWNVKTAALYRDPSAHGQIVIRWDTTKATASDRVRIEYNGQEVVYNSPTYPSQNSDLQIGHTVAQAIGRLTYNGQSYLNGYISDFHYIDGQALDASHFGKIDPVTGVWVPKKYNGTYGNNGFHLDFSDNSNTTSSTLGKDRSGNDNDWTPNNFSVAAGPGNDSLTDTPTNWGTDTGVGGEVLGNYCTLNPLDKDRNHGTLADGNLDWSTLYSDNYALIRGTFGISSGKFGFEVTNYVGAGSNNSWAAGWTKDTSDLVGKIITGTPNIPFVGAECTFPSGSTIDKFSDNTTAVTITGSSWATGATLQVLIDATNGKYWIGQGGNYYNATNSLTTFDENSPTGTFTPGNTYFPLVQVAASADNVNRSGVRVNFGQRPFENALPTGFKTLCTQNITDVNVALPATFTGNANANGPFIWANGVVETVTINGNVATEGTHFYKVAGGMKIITSSASYNSAGSNTITTATYGVPFKYARAV